MGAIADELVERATRRARDGSYAEFRSKGGAERVASTRGAAFWKYATARRIDGFARFPHDELSAYLFEESEHRVLSKATSGAGGYLASRRTSTS